MVGDGWNGFNALHTAASRVGGLDLGFAPGPDGRDTAGILEGAAAGEIGLVWLLGADEIDMNRLGNAFVGLSGPSRRRRRGPGGRHSAGRSLYREKRDLCECRGPSAAHGACHFPARRRARGLDDHPRLLGSRGTHAALRFAGPSPRPSGRRQSGLRRRSTKSCRPNGSPSATILRTSVPDPAPFRTPVQNFYMTDPIGRCSETMAQCTRMRRSLDAGARTGTDG